MTREVRLEQSGLDPREASDSELVIQYGGWDVVARCCGYWLPPSVEVEDELDRQELTPTHDEVGTTKHNWSARCQYNMTGCGNMLAYDMLSQ